MSEQPAKKISQPTKTISKEETAWYRYLLEHDISTAEEIEQFEREFPDAQGEGLMVMKLRLAGLWP